jgi:hypothetical protein
MEGNHKEAERDRDDLKKATQAKFGKLSNNHKAGEKLVGFPWILLSLYVYVFHNLGQRSRRYRQ